MTPPIRFLAVFVGGWVAIRVLALSPDAALSPDMKTAETVPQVLVELPAAPAGAPALLVASAAAVDPPAFGARPSVHWIAPGTERAEYARAEIGPVRRAPTLSAPAPVRLAALDDVRPTFVTASAAIPAPDTIVRVISPTVVPRAAGRWSGSAWLLARDDRVLPTAGVGLLGGSQTGARLAWRVNGDPARPVSLTGRLSSPLRRQGSEAAMGVEWQPVRGLPVRLLAERRQRLGGDGRSAFALLAHGGVSDRSVGAGWTLDAYAQAGVVGARRGDLFADGGATIVRPLGSGTGGLAAGGGVWGNAQPGVARLDVGPRVTTTFAAGDRPVRASLDWRFRVAGEAAPSSGPALTLATGF